MLNERHWRTFNTRTMLRGACALVVAIVLIAGPASAGAPRYELGFVDVLSGPGSEDGQARLEALEEAVRRFELFNDDTRVQVKKIDAAAGNSAGQRLRNVDGAIFASQTLLDQFVDDGDVAVTGELYVDGYSSSITGLLDTATAFLPGTVGVAVTGSGSGSSYVAVFEPPKLASLEPAQAAPGDLVLMSISGGSYGSAGSFFVDVNGTEAAMAGPELDLDTFELYGYLLQVPEGASTGKVSLEIPSLGTPAVQRSLESPNNLVIEDADQIPAPIPDPDPAPTLNHCDTVSVSFDRLGSPNFFSEIADSKDVAIADYDGDNILDVFVPQTLAKPETEYKGLGNDAAGLPQYATITGGLLTNDTTSKRQYGASAGDIDGDGDMDVVPSGSTAQGASERVRLLINNGNLTFTNEGQARISNYAGVSGTGHSWDEVSLGDVDNDGDLDVALANRSTNSSTRAALLLNTGGGNFNALPGNFGEPASEVQHDIYFCDIDNDGDLDVLMSQDFRGPSQVPLRLMINNGDANPATNTPPTWSDASSRLIPNPNADSEHVACQDFDNDGWPDIHVGVWDRADQSDDQDQIYINNTSDSNGNGTIEISEIQLNMVTNPDPTSALGQGFRAPVYSAAYGDFTGDGKVDIIVNTFIPSNKGPYLMCNRGNGTFNSISPTGAFWRDLSNTGFDHFNATSADVADLNGDGNLDIVFGLGDGMNGPLEEANRIYVLDSGSTGGGGCLQSFEAIEPCREFPVPDEQAFALDLGQVEAGEHVLVRLADMCGPLVDCQACGDPYLACEKELQLAFDFGAAGLDPRMADVRLHDFAGKLLVDGKIQDGRHVLDWTPAGEFRKDGLDQEVFVVFEIGESAGDVSLPVALEANGGR